MLPENLIPRSPLWSMQLVKLLERRQGAVSTEEACEALGCIDPRTARKHIRALGAAVDAKLPIVAELIASAPIPSESPTFPPGTNLFVILCLLWDQFITGQRELSGFSASAPLRRLLWLGPGFEHFSVFNRSCIPSAGLP